MNNGFSVALSQSWVFLKDTGDSLFCERKVTFQLEEFSYIGFCFGGQTERFSDFVKYFILRTQFDTSSIGAIIENSSTMIIGFNSIIPQMFSSFMAEQKINPIRSQHPYRTSKGYFLTIFTPEDSVTIEKYMKAVMEYMCLNRN
jgi:hypothetical protein